MLSPASSDRRDARDAKTRDNGQATVELALCLPLLFLFLLGIVQLVVIVRDDLAVQLAAREGARAAAVAESPGAAAEGSADRAVSLRPLSLRAH